MKGDEWGWMREFIVSTIVIVIVCYSVIVWYYEYDRIIYKVE